MWEPWIGSEYSRRKLLLLGESCYDWRGEAGELIHPQPDHPKMLARWAMDDPPTNQRFMAKVTRAICRAPWPTVEQAQKAWQSVAFTNYIPISVGEGSGGRKLDAAWEQARTEWPDLLNLLRPRVVIVLGWALRAHMPLADKTVDENTQAYILADGKSATCWATKHPRSGPPWEWYASFIARADQETN